MVVSKGDYAKAKIIKAAIEEFSRQGILETSFQGIADRSGFKQTAVFHHFRNKQLLLSSVLAEILKHNADVVGIAANPRDNARVRLIAYGDCNLRWAMKFRAEAQIILVLYYQATLGSDFSQTYAAIKRSAQNKLLEILHSGWREGLFKFKQSSAPMIAAVLHKLVIGGIIHCLTAQHRSKEATIFRKKWRYAIDRLTFGEPEKEPGRLDYRNR